MPMCMFTLLEKYDLTGKTIIPFCTNEGSGMGSSERDLKKLCAGATIKAGLSIHGAESANSENNVTVKNGQVKFHKIISLFQLLRLCPCFYFARAFFLSVSGLSINL